jgi:hypothetical protein
VLLLSVDVRGRPKVTGPAGWTLVRSDDNGTIMRKATFVHVLTATDPSSWTFAFSKPESATGVVAAFGGVNGQDPVLASGASSSIATRSVTAPSLAPMSASTTLVGLYGEAAAATISTPSGMLWAGSAAASAGTYKVGSGMALEPLSANTASGQKVAPLSATTSCIGQLFALRTG